MIWAIQCHKWWVIISFNLSNSRALWEVSNKPLLCNCNFLLLQILDKLHFAQSDWEAREECGGFFGGCNRRALDCWKICARSAWLWASTTHRAFSSFCDDYFSNYLGGENIRPQKKMLKKKGKKKKIKVKYGFSLWWPTDGQNYGGIFYFTAWKNGRTCLSRLTFHSSCFSPPSRSFLS